MIRHALAAFLLLAPTARAEISPVSRAFLESQASAASRMIGGVRFGRDEPPESLRKKFEALEGKPFAAAELRRILQWFHETQGDSRVEVYYVPSSRGSIILHVDYSARRKITAIAFRGNRDISENALLPVLELREGSDLDVAALEAAGHRLRKYYLSNGYLDVKVDLAVSPRGEVSFEIGEGAPSLVGSVRITPIREVEDKVLRARYEREMAEAFGVEAGNRLQRSRIEEGKIRVKDWLRNKEFVLAKDPAVEPSVQPDGTILLNVRVEYGPRIRFGFRGNNLYSYRELIQMISEVKEIAAGQDYLDAVKRKILDVYRSAGFPNVRAVSSVKEDPVRGIRQVSLSIEEGGRIRLADLRIEGIFSLSQEEAREKFEEFSSRLVQRGFYHETGINQAAAVFTDYLRGRGFLSARLEFVRNDFNADRTEARVTVLFSEGVQTILREATTAGARAIPEEEILVILGLKVEEPFNVFDFEKGLVQLKRRYDALGHMDFKVANEGTDGLVVYTPDQGGVSVNLQIDEGPVSRVGEVVVRGNKKTHARVVLREMPFITGDVLTRPLLEEAEGNLRRLNLFSSVILRSIDRPDDPTVKDVIILIDEAEPGVLEVAPGYRNDLGLRLALGVAYNNLGGWNRTIFADAILNRRLENYAFPEYNVSFGVKEPYLANWPVTLTSQVNLLRRSFTSFGASTARIVTTLSRPLSRILTGFTEHSYERTKIFDVREPYTKDDEKVIFIGSITPGIVVDSRNDRYNPTSGVLSTNRFETASRFFGSGENVGYIRATTFNSFYVSLFGDAVLAGAVNFGFERSNVQGFEIPFIKLFRLGGLGSIRGYNEDAIEVETKKTIAGSLTLVNYRGELRLPISGSFGAAAFVDAGNLAVDSVRPFVLRSSAGWGLRYNTPVGPVVLDIAWKLQSAETVGDTTVIDPSKVRFHFSIGSF
ncbi:MAG: BamA/TamA family outer membrane protein [Bdellovibrionales bacterium]|nr:BamA/TamA family outer membrane protein [Bdellovibrionales bacterium]